MLVWGYKIIIVFQFWIKGIQYFCHKILILEWIIIIIIIFNVHSIVAINEENKIYLQKHGIEL